MASLLLPKLFEFLTGSLAERKFLSTDWLIFQTGNFIELGFVQFVLWDGEVTLIFISSRINDLKLVKFLLNHDLEVLPVDFVITIFFGISILSNKVYDFWVLEINRLENYAALIISFDFLFYMFFLFLLNFGRLLWHSFGLPLFNATCLSWQLFVVLSPHHGAIFT